MMNGENHAMCAFALWEAEMQVKQLQAENAVLKGELQKAQAGNPKPRKEKSDAQL